MMYTQEQKQKICENVDKIKAYIQTLQPQLREWITIDFGEEKDYGWTREKECHLTVYEDEICGRIGGLKIVFDWDEGSSLSASVYRWFDYTIQLIENWQYIKKTLLEEIAKQQAIIDTINDFEI